MRKSICLVAGLFWLGCSMAHAGSEVGGHLINSVKGQTLTNVAIANAKANLGSVTMENSKVGGHLINSVKGQTLTNVAIANSEANLGSVTVR